MTSTIKVNKIEKVDGSTIELGGPGTSVNLASGATQSGFGRTGTVDWCTTAKTSPLTVESGKGYFLNTTSGSITVTLPSSPSAGDIVSFKDYAKTWDSNSVTVNRNGSKIAGSCLNASLTTEAQSVTLIYVDGTQGWIDIQDSTASISGSPNYVAATGGNATLTNGDFKTHIFTGDGPLNITSAGNPSGSSSVEYLIVAGGASGGASHFNGSGGGGGGAGGFRMFTTAPGSNSPLNAAAGLNVSIADFTITVGGGGAGVPAPTTYVTGNSGGVSTFSTITSAGGGGGSGGNSATAPAGNGGSGGGSGYNPLPASGQGNTPPVSPPQGQNGGNSNTGGSYAASGGGGAGAVGAGAPNCHTGGAGGDGSYIADPFFGPTAPSYGTPGPVSSVRYFSGGGGGGGGIAGYSPTPSITAGAGGAGGGGAGGGEPAPTRPGVAGTVNTGGASGGNSASFSPPAVGLTLAGGSGFVAIRYKFQN